MAAQMPRKSDSKGGGRPMCVTLTALAATPPSRWNVAGTLMHPVVESHLGIVALAARFVAVQRGNWTALLVLRIAAERGAPPATLEELQCSSRIVDPLSGQSFAYRVDGGTFTLCSIGPERDDDGGRRQARTCQPTETAASPGGDLVFWPPEERPASRDRERVCPCVGGGDLAQHLLSL